MKRKAVVVIGVFLFIFSIYLVMASGNAPFVSFNSPTPSNGTLTQNTSVKINATISGENISSIIYDWNGVNYTFYNSSLVLFYTFDTDKVNDGTITDDSLSGSNGITPVSSFVTDSFESGTDGWTYRDGSWTTPLQDCSNSYSGSCSINMSVSNDAFGSEFIYKPVFETGGMVLSFNYKCDPGLKWGMMFSGSNWYCIQGSGSSGCGGSYIPTGEFSPSIVCDDTWRTASFDLGSKFGSASVNSLIVGDWSPSNSANTTLWFDNFVMSNSSGGSFEPGKYFNGFALNGNESIDTPLSNDAHSWTLSTWFNASSFLSNSWIDSPIIDSDSPGKYGTGMGVSNSTISIIYNNGFLSDSYNFNVGEEYMLTVVYDYANNQIISYVNGQQVQTTNVTFDNSQYINFSIGKDTANDVYFNGTLDQIQIYNRTLSASEVYQLYSSDLQKTNLTSWNLYINQGQNATSGLSNGNYIFQISASDSSGNASNTEQRTVKIRNFSSPFAISVVYPESKEYNNEVPFAISGTQDLSSCLFSLDNWSENYTMAKENNTYFTHSDLLLNPGDYTARFLCENIFNDVENSSVNFTISQPPKSQGKVHNYFSGSGGSCVTNWSCSGWSFCSINNTQMRICKPTLSYCYTEGEKPVEIRTCPDVLFDVATKVVQNALYSGGNLSIQVNLTEKSAPQNVDVYVTYNILDSSGNVIYNESETRAVNESLEYIKTFNGLDLQTGNYNVIVQVRYGKNQFASSQYAFSVGASYLWLRILIVVLLVLFILWMFYKIDFSKKIRKVHHRIRNKFSRDKHFNF